MSEITASEAKYLLKGDEPLTTIQRHQIAMVIDRVLAAHDETLQKMGRIIEQDAQRRKEVRTNANPNRSQE